MITENLFDEILIKPIAEGADELCIVSGYATAAMAFHHLQKIRKLKAAVQIRLIVGMSVQDKLSLSNHKGLQKLVEDYPESFECSYIYTPPAVHSKIYVWLKESKPFTCYAGSVNYTQKAFSGQREIITKCDAEQGLAYFQHLTPDTVFCTHPDAEKLVRLRSDQKYVKAKRKVTKKQEERLKAVSGAENVLELPSMCVSLLDKDDNLPQRSGLNWGQRPEHHREPNQAYIRLSAEIYHSDFFPPRTVHFTVLTDDGKVLICTRAQDNGKAIHTPHNNSLIGEYFRNRLGIPFGGAVQKNHLDRYGRHDICFYKIDEETYFMDFSV